VSKTDPKQPQRMFKNVSTLTPLGTGDVTCPTFGIGWLHCGFQYLSLTYDPHKQRRCLVFSVRVSNIHRQQLPRTMSTSVQGIAHRITWLATPLLTKGVPLQVWLQLANLHVMRIQHATLWLLVDQAMEHALDIPQRLVRTV
jgi:hypothetical protein